MKDRRSWIIMKLLVIFYLPISTGKKSMKNYARMARAYGYPERKILALKDTPIPPKGCSSSKRHKDFFATFRTQHEVENFILERICELRKEIGAIDSGCSVEKIGVSVEGRNILSINLKGTNGGLKLGKILILGTIHGREWISTTSALLCALKVDAIDFDLVFVPLVNPDGYDFTWSGSTTVKKRYFKGRYEDIEVKARLFRKNRRINSDLTVGVDLNRNFGTKNKTWGVARHNRSINMTSSDIFQGSKAFSEPETKALKDLVARHGFIGVIDLHCCIPAVLEPVTVSRTKDRERTEHVGKSIVSAINKRAPWDEKYSWMPREDAPSYGSGLSSGYFYEDAAIPFVYVIELRGKFVLPCTLIKPIGTEALAGLKGFMQELKRLKENNQVSSKLVSPEQLGPKHLSDEGNHIFGNFRILLFSFLLLLSFIIYPAQKQKGK